LCAASVALFVWQVTDERTVEFLNQNMLRAIPRQALFGTMLGAAVGTGALTLGYFSIARDHRLDVQRFTRVAAPLMLLGFVPAVAMRAMWDPLSTAIAVVAFTLVTERLLRSMLQEVALATQASTEIGFSAVTARPRRIALAATALGSIVYAVYTSIYTIFDYRRFAPPASELAQYDNVFFSTLHLHPFRCAPLGLVSDWQYLGKHAVLSVFAFLPFYAVRPGPETLLVLRACVLGLGAIPVYLFAARRMQPLHACILAICYLLYPPLHSLNFHAFSLQPLAATFLLFGILWVDSKRWIPAAIAFALAVGCGENAALGLVVLGLFLLVSAYRTTAGAVIAAVAACYLLLVKLVVVPHFASTWSAEARSLAANTDELQGFGEFVKTLASNPAYVIRNALTPDKLGYLLQLLAPVALFPVRRAYLLPAIVPGTLLVLAGAKSSGAIDLDLPHSEHFVPYVFAASAVALGSYRSGPLGRVRFSAAMAALAVGTLLCTIHWGAFPPHPGQGFLKASFASPSPIDEKRANDLAELSSMIPPDATYGVSDQEMAHVSKRLTVRPLKHQPPPDYILYGVDGADAPIAGAALTRGEYLQVASRTGLALLKRKP
jgi:uncharacterized membrane protein